jgi:hypothetical protein
MNTNRIHATAVLFKRRKGASKNRSANFSFFFPSICLYNIIGSDRYLWMLYENFSDIDKSHTICYLFFGYSLKDFDPIFFGAGRFLRVQRPMYNKGDYLKVRRTGEDRR